MPWDDDISEARRVLSVCAICNYCNGYCDVFDAIGLHRHLDQGDVQHLAHLCHNCRSCASACQYFPPHELSVNLPRTLAQIRQSDLDRLGWTVGRSWLAWVLAALPPILAVIFIPGDVLFAPHHGPGAFYRILPWPLITAAAAAALGWSGVGLLAGMVRHWRQTGMGTHIPTILAALPGALWDAISLRNLDGGQDRSCRDALGRPAPWRRRFHHALVAGMAACFAATIIATWWHHGLGLMAPYALTSLPVLAGTGGGILMLIGCLGLFWLGLRADPQLDWPQTRRANRSLLAVLAFIALTGLALLPLRDGPAMGIVLAIHLGAVLGFFATLAQSKLAHAPYRFLALLRARMDRRS